MNQDKALDLAQRYSFVLLDKLCLKYPEEKPLPFEIRKTFNLYEEMFKKLGFDKVEKNIIKCLEKLPTSRDWVHLTEEEINRLSKELKLSNE